MFIEKNRPRTTVAEPIGETLAELPFTGDQAVCLGHDKAAWSGPALYRGQAGAQQCELGPEEQQVELLGIEIVVGNA